LIVMFIFNIHVEVFFPKNPSCQVPHTPTLFKVEVDTGEVQKYKTMGEQISYLSLALSQMKLR
jgi:hypothetical protein